MERKDAWRLYFMTAMGWKLHPGYKRDNAAGHEEAMQFAFDIANRMLDMEKDKWDGWQQHR